MSGTEVSWAFEEGPGFAHLEHLDEGNGEVEVGQIAADQTQAEEDTNGDNCADVDPAGHLDRLAAIEEGSPVGEDLGHQGREDEVVGRQNDRVACSTISVSDERRAGHWISVLTEVEGIKNPFVEQNDRGGQADPDAGRGRTVSRVGSGRSMGLAGRKVAVTVVGVFFGWNLRDVEGRVDGRLLGLLQLLGGRVDCRQD